MAYVDPATNPGSKIQRLRDENSKSCTNTSFGAFFFLKTSDQKHYLLIE